MKANGKIKVAFITIIFLVSISGIYLLHEVDSAFYSAGAILLSASLALIAALMNITFTRKTARESNSLDFQKSLQSDVHYNEHVRKSAAAAKSRKDMRELAKVENRFDEDAISIRYVLNTWERAANAMRHNLYDELYLFEAHKSMVIAFGIDFREFIDECQKRQPSFYENFSWLALNWTIRRDSFQEANRKKQLKKIFKMLNKVALHKIH
ncbi:hypothetical protein KUL42_11810 [Alteromonas sp. KUL42]|uniref:DUF4760 domain-containing protein n=1 Tax=Alteromonas sp. KUL42 TaxID=2480797 RepID=UPI001036ECAF|nr:DUF4760 domain-containing protein [Alteromonas sp. KUL42]TAP37023.1 DUF4760 domain-containing protein [Alteromonas sp. KUL42]GEA06420.1 hypothetical protein KUL42_11810 [Alteromonas sp. KUL42]